MDEIGGRHWNNFRQLAHRLVRLQGSSFNLHDICQISIFFAGNSVMAQRGSFFINLPNSILFVKIGGLYLLLHLIWFRGFGVWYVILLIFLQLQQIGWRSQLLRGIAAFQCLDIVEDSMRELLDVLRFSEKRLDSFINDGGTQNLVDSWSQIGVSIEHPFNQLTEFT